MLSVSIMTSVYLLIGTLIAIGFVKEYDSHFADYINGYLALATAALFIVLFWLPLIVLFAVYQLKNK